MPMNKNELKKYLYGKVAVSRAEARSADEWYASSGWGQPRMHAHTHAHTHTP